MRFFIIVPALLLGLMTGSFLNMMAEISLLNQHIQVLEEYIEDNGLPTPANPQGEPCPTEPIEIIVDC